MFAIAVLAPGLVLGAIAWGVVGVLRQRGREDFTQATAAAFYAQVMIVVGVLATLAGGAVLVKLGLSLIDPSYSYTVAMPGIGYTPPSAGDQQAQDLILAAMLAGVGLVVAGGHRLLAVVVERLPGGSPAWVRRGTLVAVTALTGLAGFLSLIVAGYQVLTYFIVGSQQAGTFGDAAGAAAVFVPAWAAAMTLLLRHLRSAPAQPPAVGVAHAG